MMYPERNLKIKKYDLNHIKEDNQELYEIIVPAIFAIIDDEATFQILSEKEKSNLIKDSARHYVNGGRIDELEYLIIDISVLPEAEFEFSLKDICNDIIENRNLNIPLYK